MDGPARKTRFWSSGCAVACALLSALPFLPLLLPLRPSSGLGPSAGFGIRDLRERSGHVVADLETPSAGVVHFAENWHRHWRASVDGAPAAILHANSMFMAVLIPTAGPHRIEFRFGG